MRNPPTDTETQESNYDILVSGARAETNWNALAERLANAALTSLAQRGIAPSRGELSVLLVDDQEIQDYNRLYRGKDVPTDVLSFSQLEGDGENPSLLPPGYPLPIGDIVISIPRMREQAAEYGHGEDREFGFLLIHGLLHLLGFDHQNEADLRTMQEITEELLASAGLSRDAVDA
jgi:probable rRNA maturation factor